MGFKENLMGVGIGAEKANILGSETTTNTPTRSSATTLTATGTNLATALALTSLNNVLTTVALNTGVKLPTVTPIGAMVVIQNNGANPLNVFPPTATGTLNAGSAGAAVTTAAAAGALCIRVSATDWLVYVTAKEA